MYKPDLVTILALGKETEK